MRDAKKLFKVEIVRRYTGTVYVQAKSAEAANRAAVARLPDVDKVTSTREAGAR